jgi:hypothetical protein
MKRKKRRKVSESTAKAWCLKKAKRMMGQGIGKIQKTFTLAAIDEKNLQTKVKVIF